MKKLFITIIAFLLPLLAMGQTLSGTIAEADFTTATEFTGWTQFDDSQTDGKVELTSEGLAITVGIQTGQLWQPQVMVVPDGSFDLEENGNYKVVVTAKFPANGTLQINMGTWSANDQAQFPVEATGDFQEVVCEFPDWSFDAEGAHLLFHCGDFKGTTIIKKIQIADKELGGTGTDICYNYIPKGKIAEVIPHTNGKYYGAIEIPAKVMHEGVEYTVKKINSDAFNGCSKLTSVTIPNSVTSIGDNAFANCSLLASITIPNNLSSIGNYAFQNCGALTTVTIPNSVTSIGNGAFNNCTKMSSLSLPNSITSIGNSTFLGCTGLTSLTLPNSVTSIGSYAFYGCSGLSTLVLPTNLTNISIQAFYQCSSLTSVNIPNSIDRIGSQAFNECSGLTSVTVGSGINYINSLAFANCSNLEDFYCLAENVPSTLADAFNNSYLQYATLHVPASAINTYKTTEPWSGFGTFETLSGDAPVMPKCATPTISIEDGKIKFSCETEGAEFVSNVSTTDTKDYYDAELTLTFKYKVTVYATKSGYENSDTATAEIEVPGELKGDLNNDGTVNVADHVELTKIIMNE